MEVTNEKLREVVHNLLEKNGENGALMYISSTDWSSDIKERAIQMINGLPEEEVAMAENGDISDMGGF